MGMSGDWPLAVEKAAPWCGWEAVFLDTETRLKDELARPAESPRTVVSGMAGLVPVVVAGSTTQVKNQLYRVWKVTHA